MTEYGLSFNRVCRRFLWAFDSGWTWLPYWLADLIARSGNRLLCFFGTHSDIVWHLAQEGYVPADEPVRCVDCLARITRCLCTDLSP